MRVSMYGNSIDGCTILSDQEFDVNGTLEAVIAEYKTRNPEPCSSYVFTVVLPPTDPRDYRIAIIPKGKVK